MRRLRQNALDKANVSSKGESNLRDYLNQRFQYDKSIDSKLPGRGSKDRKQSAIFDSDGRF